MLEIVVLVQVEPVIVWDDIGWDRDPGANMERLLAILLLCIRLLILVAEVAHAIAIAVFVELNAAVFWHEMAILYRKIRREFFLGAAVLIWSRILWLLDIVVNLWATYDRSVGGQT